MTTALMAVDDGLFSGNYNLADVAFLAAVIAAVLSAVGGFGTNQLTKHAGWLLSAAVALAAFGWMVL
jgi:hypothetical protein